MWLVRRARERVAAAPGRPSASGRPGTPADPLRPPWHPRPTPPPPWHRGRPSASGRLGRPGAPAADGQSFSGLMGAATSDGSLRQSTPGTSTYSSISLPSGSVMYRLCVTV